MKVIILLSVIALGYANILFGAQKDIKVDNKRIVIHTPRKTVIIEEPTDDKTCDECVQVVVMDQDRIIRKIKMDKNKRIIEKDFSLVEDELAEGMSAEKESTEMKTTSFDEQTARNKRSDFSHIQADNPSMTVIVNIFRRYEGVIGEQTFQNLLGEIEKAVFDNKLHPIIFDILKGLEVRGFFDTPLKRLIDWYKIRREQGTGYWSSEDTIQEHNIKQQDQQQKMDMFTTSRILNTLADENRLNEQIEKKLPQHHLIDDNNLNDEETSSLLWVIKNTRFFQESDLRQLMYQRNIREIQRRIIYHQRKAQQLQLQQLFLNNKKQQLKLQRVIGQQRGPFMEMHELDQICSRLQEQELKLLDMQLNFHRTIKNLQQELIKQEEMLRQCLEGDRNKDEIFNI